MKHREETLDLIRGLSALLVMLGHLRAFIFLDYGDLSGAGLLTKTFYFATGLGHQAVMVFFVLSGYFVGGSVLSLLIQERFTWQAYASARLTRLWMVLLPALLLTLGVDFLGDYLNPSAYAGAMSASFMSGPSVAQPAAHDLVTFLGNLCFVQAVHVPIYGSNGPLWSLANEFWYYVMFPLLAVSGARLFETQRRWPTAIQLLLFMWIAWWLPRPLVMAGLIWVMGVGVWWLVRNAEMGRQNGAERHSQERTRCAQRGTPSGAIRSDGGGQGAGRQERRSALARCIACCRGWPWRLVGGFLFLGTLAASKTDHWLGSDGAVGFVFATWMLSLPGSWRMPVWFNRVVTGLSEISYTLYVVHFPLLFFVAAVVLNGHQFPADFEGYLWFGGLSAFVLAISVGMWWFFERNTDLVRKRLWRGGA